MTNSEEKLCSLVTKYWTDPVRDPEVRKFVVFPLIQVNSVTEFNWNKGTLTLDLILKLTWNDTRLSLTDDNLCVFYFEGILVKKSIVRLLNFKIFS